MGLLVAKDQRLGPEHRPSDPGLPFADDSRIPLDDPAAIEVIGRHPGGGTRGRDDLARPRGRAGWVAYTGCRQPNRQHRHGVQFPEHGRRWPRDRSASLDLEQVFWAASAEPRNHPQGVLQAVPQQVFTDDRELDYGTICE